MIKKNLDLRNQNAVRKFFKARKPEVVIIAAAKVGGIKANIKYPANFISDNLQIQTNLISLSHDNNIKKLILFGSSCIYPKGIKKPIKKPNNDRCFGRNKRKLRNSKNCWYQNDRVN